MSTAINDRGGNICPDRVWTDVDVLEASSEIPTLATAPPISAGPVRSRFPPNERGRAGASQHFLTQLRTTVSRISRGDVWGLREHMGP